MTLTPDLTPSQRIERLYEIEKLHERYDYMPPDDAYMEILPQLAGLRVWARAHGWIEGESKATEPTP